MKQLSKGSIVFIVLGLFLLGVNWRMEGYLELIVLIGLVFLFVGALLSLIAIAKQEEGSLKFVSLFSFFIVLFFITWLEPFQVIRILTWLKN
ncbi:hypothetical protein [Peribacillus sp. SCS-37]|uniref:hypothetical protein n=1 Tax=Paraperibacillus esterisolvens TaxID=3115296 RepID=UPI003905BB90